MKKIFLILAIATSFYSCKKDDSDLMNITPPEIKEYVQKFIDEAQKRGIKIKYKKVRAIYLVDCIDGGHDGVYQQWNNTILIDTSDSKYALKREVLIFHELAHALLGKEHNNAMLPNGDPCSIMHEAIGADYEIFGTTHFIINGNPVTIYQRNLYKREYYIDELFGFSTPVPDWAK